MKHSILLLTTIALALTACENGDYLLGPGGPGGTPGDQPGVSTLKDPDLAWSADSFEATIGSENVFPTLSNIYNVSVTYESSKPEVATISSSGTITLVKAGSTLITASSKSMAQRSRPSS